MKHAERVCGLPSALPGNGLKEGVVFQSGRRPQAGAVTPTFSV